MTRKTVLDRGSKSDRPHCHAHTRYTPSLPLTSTAPRRTPRCARSKLIKQQWKPTTTAKCVGAAHPGICAPSLGAQNLRLSSSDAPPPNSTVVMATGRVARPKPRRAAFTRRPSTLHIRVKPCSQPVA